MAVYLASSHELPLVPWDAEQPAFHVDALDHDDSAILERLDLPFVRYVGSHEGCGCGFQNPEYEGVAPEERSEKRAALLAFADYLEKELARGARMTLYACWEGDQGAPLEHRRVLRPHDLRAPAFEFLEKEHSDIRAR